MINKNLVIHVIQTCEGAYPPHILTIELLLFKL